MENKTMMTDYYEVTMSQAYFDQGCKEEMAYFDVFYRSNPFHGGYLMTGGLGEIIEYIKNFKITEEDIDYLQEISMRCQMELLLFQMNQLLRYVLK